jgi:hypothetical protein
LAGRIDENYEKVSISFASLQNKIRKRAPQNTKQERSNLSATFIKQVGISKEALVACSGLHSWKLKKAAKILVEGSQ